MNEGVFMKKIVLEVRGMTCEHCVARVNKAVSAVKGVSQATTVLKDNASYIMADDEIKPEELKSAVEEAGYEAGKITTE